MGVGASDQHVNDASVAILSLSQPLNPCWWDTLTEPVHHFSPCSVQTHHWIFNSILILWNDSRLLLLFNSFGSMYNSITGWEIHQVTQWICLHQFRKTRHSVIKLWKKSCIIWNAPPAASMFSHKKSALNARHQIFCYTNSQHFPSLRILPTHPESWLLSHS